MGGGGGTYVNVNRSSSAQSKYEPISVLDLENGRMKRPDRHFRSPAPFNCFSFLDFKIMFFPSTGDLHPLIRVTF